jgi:hypothetical protein
MAPEQDTSKSIEATQAVDQVDTTAHDSEQQKPETPKDLVNGRDSLVSPEIDDGDSLSALLERVKTIPVYIDASDDLKRAMLDQVEASFTETRKNEIAEKQKQRDAAAQEVIDRLKGGEALESVIPETLTIDGSDKEPSFTDATEDKSPIDEDSGNWKPQYTAGSVGSIPPTPGGPIASMHLMEKDRENELPQGVDPHEENLGDIQDRDEAEHEG